MILQRFGAVAKQCDWQEGQVSVKTTGLNLKEVCVLFEGLSADTDLCHPVSEGFCLK